MTIITEYLLYSVVSVPGYSGKDPDPGPSPEFVVERFLSTLFIYVYKNVGTCICDLEVAIFDLVC